MDSFQIIPLLKSDIDKVMAMLDCDAEFIERTCCRTIESFLPSLLPLREKLIKIYREPGFVADRLSPSEVKEMSARVHAIGEEIYRLSGPDIEFMILVCRSLMRIPAAYRFTELAWDGIGEWRG